MNKYFFQVKLLLDKFYFPIFKKKSKKIFIQIFFNENILDNKHQLLIEQNFQYQLEDHFHFDKI